MTPGGAFLVRIACGEDGCTATADTTAEIKAHLEYGAHIKIEVEPELPSGWVALGLDKGYRCATHATAGDNEQWITRPWERKR